MRVVDRHDVAFLDGVSWCNIGVLKMFTCFIDNAEVCVSKRLDRLRSPTFIFCNVCVRPMMNFDTMLGATASRQSQASNTWAQL